MIWETMSHDKVRAMLSPLFPQLMVYEQPEDIDGTTLADTVQQERDLSNRKLAQNQREISHQIESIRNDLTLLAREVRELIELQKPSVVEKRE